MDKTSSLLTSTCSRWSCLPLRITKLFKCRPERTERDHAFHVQCWASVVNACWPLMIILSGHLRAWPSTRHWVCDHFGTFLPVTRTLSSNLNVPTGFFSVAPSPLFALHFVRPYSSSALFHSSLISLREFWRFPGFSYPLLASRRMFSGGENMDEDTIYCYSAFYL